MQTMKRLQKAVLIGLAVFGLGTAQAAGNYPDRPIKLLVGFSAGAATDSITRHYAKQLSERLGTPVVVENRTGSGGNIAIQAVTRAEPDGYTLVMGGVYVTVNAALGRNPYDWKTELTPIAPVAAISNLLVVPNDSPLNSVKDLIEQSRRGDRPLTYGSAGIGTSMHMSGELLKSMTGANIEHIPYRGAAPAELDLVAKRLDFMFDNIATAIPLVRGGDLKALAISGTVRTPEFPELPTVDEAGVTGFDVTGSYIIFGPAGLAPAIAAKLNKAINEVSADPETHQFVGRLYASTLSGGPDVAKTMLNTEYDKWSKLVSEGEIKLE